MIWAAAPSWSDLTSPSTWQSPCPRGTRKGLATASASGGTTTSTPCGANVYQQVRTWLLACGSRPLIVKAKAGSGRPWAGGLIPGMVRRPS
jgi:hypothetical protein